MEQFSFLEFRKSLVGKITRVLPNRTRCSACCLNLALTVSGRGRRGLTRLLRLAVPHKIEGSIDAVAQSAHDIAHESDCN